MNKTREADRLSVGGRRRRRAWSSLQAPAWRKSRSSSRRRAWGREGPAQATRGQHGTRARCHRLIGCAPTCLRSRRSASASAPRLRLPPPPSAAWAHPAGIGPPIRARTSPTAWTSRSTAEDLPWLTPLSLSLSIEIAYNFSMFYSRNSNSMCVYICIYMCAYISKKYENKGRRVMWWCHPR